MINEANDVEQKLEAMKRSASNIRTFKNMGQALSDRLLQASIEENFATIRLKIALQKEQLMAKAYEQSLAEQSVPPTKSQQESLAYYAKTMQEAEEQIVTMQQMTERCAQKTDALNMALDNTLTKIVEAEIAYNELATEVAALGIHSHHVADFSDTDAL